MSASTSRFSEAKEMTFNRRCDSPSGFRSGFLSPLRVTLLALLGNVHVSRPHGAGSDPALSLRCPATPRPSHPCPSPPDLCEASHPQSPCTTLHAHPRPSSRWFLLAGRVWSAVCAAFSAVASYERRRPHHGWRVLTAHGQPRGHPTGTSAPPSSSRCPCSYWVWGEPAPRLVTRGGSPAHPWEPAAPGDAP